MTRRGALASLAALVAPAVARAQVLGVRHAVPEDARTVDAGISVSGHCPIPNCGTLVGRTLRDVKRSEIKGVYYLLLICPRDGCAFGVEVKS